MLDDYPFANGYADAGSSAAAIADALGDRFGIPGGHAVFRIEMLRTLFFRERRAYIVGRALTGRAAAGAEWVPLVVALVNDTKGVRADAVLTEIGHVSPLFGFSRSYFLADLPSVGDAVVFLHALMPHKPIGELYTVLGRAKQGKTERYRALFHHLSTHPAERLVRADGALVRKASESLAPAAAIEAFDGSVALRTCRQCGHVQPDHSPLGSG